MTGGPPTASTAAGDSIVIPNGLIAPLPTFNTWFFAFGGVLIFLCLPLLILTAYLIARWSRDWRHRPEMLTGKRSWEVEVFGCRACGREPTNDSFGVGEFHDEESGSCSSGTTKSNEAKWTRPGPGVDENAQGSKFEAGRIHTDEEGFEKIELTAVEPNGEPTTNPLKPINTSKLPAFPERTLPSLKRGKAPAPLQLGTAALVDPMECELRTEKTRVPRTSMMDLHLTPRRVWRRSIVGIPESAVPVVEGEVGVQRQQRRSWRGSGQLTVGHSGNGNLDRIAIAV